MRKDATQCGYCVHNAAKKQCTFCDRVAGQTAGLGEISRKYLEKGWNAWLVRLFSVCSNAKRVSLD